MGTDTNETCIGKLNKNYYLMGEGMKFMIAEKVNLLKGIFLVKKMSKFLIVGWDSFLSLRFPKSV